MFSFGERLGIFFPIMGAGFSALSVSLILLFAGFRWLRRTLSSGGRSQRSPDACDNIIFLNLMFAQLIQALGDLLLIKWMADGDVTEGRFCTAQFMIKLLESNGVALSSLAISVYTFCVLVLRWSIPRYISKLVVLLIWIFIALAIGILHIVYKDQRFYGNVGYWCWIIQKLKAEQLLYGYVGKWVSALLMAILYIIMFIVMRGWLIVDNGVWYWYGNYRPRYGVGQPEIQEETDLNSMAKLLLLYPAVYLICILPKSIARRLHYSGYKVPYQVTFATQTFLSLSGIFDAILFYFTRPDLVVGAAYSPSPASALELTNTSLGELGSLPNRDLAAASDVPPDLERGCNGRFESYNFTEDANSNICAICASRLRIGSDLDSHATATQMSGKQSYANFRSVPAPAPVEESHGHLPG